MSIAELTDLREHDHGEEVGVDWVNGLVIHEHDEDWHPWDPAIYGGTDDE